LLFSKIDLDVFSKCQPTFRCLQFFRIWKWG